MTAPASPRRADQTPTVTAIETLEQAAALAADPTSSLHSAAWAFALVECERIVTREAGRITRNVNRFDLYDDILQECRLTLWDLLRTYKPDRGMTASSFVITYLRLQTQKRIFALLPPVHVPTGAIEAGLRVNGLSMDAPLTESGDRDSESSTLADTFIAPCDVVSEAARNEVVHRYMGMNDNAGTAMLFLLAGFNQKEAAASLGVSPARVGQYVKSLIK